MAGKLSIKRVAALKKPGRFGDGDGLYLSVSGWGTKAWVYRYQLRGRSHEMGLGPYPLIGLAEARERVTKWRRLKLDGVDPIEARRGEQTQARLEEARAITFASCAASYIKAHEAGWRNQKHRYQWRATMDTACKVLGPLSVASIDTGLVLKVLEPIWREKPETAKRLRGRIEAVLDLAIAHGFRTGPNPSRLKGHLDKLLTKTSNRVQHHPALAYSDLPGFMAELRIQDGVAARALEFTILTAARTGEVLGAKRSEFGFAMKAWTIPSARMKSGREHRVPLCDRALTILSGLPREDGNHFMFIGAKQGKPLHSLAMLNLLRDLRSNPADLTVHGFRSTFRDWCAEQTNFPREIAETALAHSVADATERAYARGDLFEKRRKLMDAWERFCASTPVAEGSNVLTMKR